MVGVIKSVTFSVSIIQHPRGTKQDNRSKRGNAAQNSLRMTVLQQKVITQHKRLMHQHFCSPSQHRFQVEAEPLKILVKLVKKSPVFCDFFFLMSPPHHPDPSHSLACFRNHSRSARWSKGYLLFSWLPLHC